MQTPSKTNQKNYIKSLKTVLRAALVLAFLSLFQAETSIANDNYYQQRRNAQALQALSNMWQQSEQKRLRVIQEQNRRTNQRIQYNNMMRQLKTHCGAFDYGCQNRTKRFGN